MVDSSRRRRPRDGDDATPRAAAERLARIRVLVDEDAPIEEIAADVGLTVDHVRRLLIRKQFVLNDRRRFTRPDVRIMEHIVLASSSLLVEADRINFAAAKPEQARAWIAALAAARLRLARFITRLKKETTDAQTPRPSSERHRLETSRKFGLVPISTMRVPEIGVIQRRFNAAAAERIRDNLDLDALGYPVVNIRDGVAWVIDGQHRLFALRERGFA